MRRFAALLLPLFFAPAVSAKVWTVAPSGGDFTTIQPAVDAAADGDVVLVAPSVYLEAAVVDAKALTLVGAPWGLPVYAKSLTIKNLAAAQRVVVRGIDLVDAFPVSPFAEGITVTGCAGAVWIEDCALDGRAGFAVFNQTLPGEPALRVEASDAVTAIRCDLEGGLGHTSFPFPGPAGDGAHVVSGSLALWDCAVVGGASGSQQGDGLRIDAGKLMTSGTSVAGGSASADGLVVTAAGVSVETLDSTFSSVQAPPGTISTWPAAARSLELLTPVKEGATVTAQLRGVPGDLVFLFSSVTGGHAQIAGTQGWYVLGPPMGPFFLLTITDPSGEVSFFAPAPPLVQPALGGFTFLLQPYFLRPGETVAGAGSAFVLLKA